MSKRKGENRNENKKKTQKKIKHASERKCVGRNDKKNKKIAEENKRKKGRGNEVVMDLTNAISS